jgi:hypothetical protein
MIKVKKLNVALKIDESQLKEYKLRGYEVVEEKKKPQTKKSEASK